MRADAGRSSVNALTKVSIDCSPSNQSLTISQSNTVRAPVKHREGRTFESDGTEVVGVTTASKSLTRPTLLEELEC